VSGVAEIGRAAWDSVANPGWASDRPLAHAAGPAPYNPFVCFDFIDCLEQSGSASKRTGWTPSHLVIDGADGALAGAMPAYFKSHSMGEYVFDHGWAEGYQRAGGRYYPKLQGAVPFTPVPGPRLLVRPGPGEAARRTALAEAAIELTQQQRASSAHVTFATEHDWNVLAGAGFLKRTDQQFHFLNAGYGDFGDFLASLASRKRKAVRKERAGAVENGITIEVLNGAEITPAAWDAFFAFYMDTGGRKWGSPYLNRRFFAMLGERMADRVLLVMAKRAGRYVAGALNLIGSDTLYGRYWGCIERHPFLHFEVCYYQAIEWAIGHGLKRVEAGAQGEHKLARGYVPRPTYSAHWIADPRFRAAVADYLQNERAQSAREMESLSEHAPFRKDRPQGDEQDAEI
jgi:predicted N-acyltransferase